MGYKVISLVVFLLLISCTHTGYKGASAPLFVYDGKEVYLDDLSDELKLKIYKDQEQHYKRTTEYLQEAAIEWHIANTAKQKNISNDEVKKQIVNSIGLPAWGMDKKEVRSKVFDKISDDNEIEFFVGKPSSLSFNIKTQGFPAKGLESSQVVMVVYCSFINAECKDISAMTSELIKAYPEDLRVVYKYLPASNTEFAFNFEKSGYCAAEQNKFWEYSDYVYTAQSDLMSLDIVKIAEKLTFNIEQFKECLEMSSGTLHIQESTEEATKYGVDSAPAIFINGRKLSQPINLDNIKQEIDYIL